MTIALVIISGILLVVLLVQRCNRHTLTQQLDVVCRIVRRGMPEDFRERLEHIRSELNPVEALIELDPASVTVYGHRNYSQYVHSARLGYKNIKEEIAVLMVALGSEMPTAKD